MRGKCRSWDKPGWNCLLTTRGTHPETPGLAGNLSHLLETFPTISQIPQDQVLPCSMPQGTGWIQKGCKPQGIPSPAQTPGTDTTPHIQLCPERLPTFRLVLSQEKGFAHPTPFPVAHVHSYRGRQQLLTVLRLQAGFGTAGFTRRDGEKRENIPKISTGAVV